MTTPIKLSELLIELDSHNDEIEQYFHKPRGEFVCLGLEIISGEGDDEELSRRIEASPDDYIGLPDRFEINGYRIMEDFIDSLDDEKSVEILSSTIRGSGAFRRFKEMLDILEITDRWYSFRTQAYKNIAIEWCKENELAFEDD